MDIVRADTRDRERHFGSASRFRVDDATCWRAKLLDTPMPQMQSGDASEPPESRYYFRTHSRRARLDAGIARLVVKEFGNDTFKVECGGLRQGSNTVDLTFRSPESGGHLMKCTCGFCRRHGIPCRHVLAVTRRESPFLRPTFFCVAVSPCWNFRVPWFLTYAVAAAGACVARLLPKPPLSRPCSFLSRFLGRCPPPFQEFLSNLHTGKFSLAALCKPGVDVVLSDLAAFSRQTALMTTLGVAGPTSVRVVTSVATFSSQTWAGWTLLASSWTTGTRPRSTGTPTATLTSASVLPRWRTSRSTPPSCRPSQ